MTKSRAKVGELLPYLLGKLKAPGFWSDLEQTAERARAEQWPDEQFLETMLDADVFARVLNPCIAHATAPLKAACDEGCAQSVTKDADETPQLPSACRPRVNGDGASQHF